MSDVTKYLVAQGVLGVVCVVAIAAAGKLYADLKAERDRNDTRAEKMSEKMTEALVSASRAIDAFREALNRRR